MHKKVVIISLLCLLFAVVLLTGCSGGEKPPVTTPLPSADEGESAPTTPSVTSSVSKEEEEASVADIFARAKGIEGLYFEFVMTSGEEKTEGKTWSKGKLLKNEISVDGEIVLSIIDIDKGEAYTYMPAQNLAMKTEIDMTMVQEFQQPTEYTDNIDPELVKIVETTMYEGLKCKVMILTNDQDQEEMKMWISEEYGIPLRVETMEDGSKTIVEYKNLEVGPIPDDVFTIPQGVEILEMNTNFSGS